MEQRLAACLLSISHLLSQGLVLDAGANDGKTTKMLAQMFNGRHVLSVEPLRNNVATIHSMKRSLGLNKVTILHGGLGQHAGYDSYPASIEKVEAGAQSQIGLLENYKSNRSQTDEQVQFRVYTVDYLMHTKRLALAHWDVEGGELSVLKGASATILRDNPVFTVESFPKTNADGHARLMAYVEGTLGYACLQIVEVCGFPVDCRNHVCVPQRHRKTLLSSKECLAPSFGPFSIEWWQQGGNKTLVQA